MSDTQPRNGAHVLDRKPRGDDELVLCKWHGHYPFVTWRMDRYGNCEHGHYFETIARAVLDFHTR